jgi:predicted phage baseplate assembly protein
MLPAPNLDDRTFQNLVDDAKRYVQQHCPEWTDHNVSDPGVTLMEAVAQMIEQLIYRLNRVPELNYIKFLELMGVELSAPAAARGEATFWLSAPQPQPVLVRAESQVATPRTDVSDPVVFSTTRELAIIPCEFAHAATQANESTPVDTTMALGRGGLRAFSTRPVVGDALLIGLSAAVPSCAVLLRLNCEVSGRGVDPRRPPIEWDAWTDGGWVACDYSDETGGLNKPGDVILHVPHNHQSKVIGTGRAGWLRCRLVEAPEGVPTYDESPTVTNIEAYTIGGTAPTVNAELVRSEILGRSDGTPAQRFPLQRRAVVAFDEPLTLTVLDGDDAQTWSSVRNFADSGPDDLHFRLDAYAGEIHFGPAPRMVGGGLRLHGAIPPAGAVLRLEAYRTGGGQAGNVARGQVRVLKTSIPYVSRVENRSPAIGGAEAETLEDAKTRGPLLLRSQGRAVTAVDFEQLARHVAPEIARAHCVVEEGSGVMVLVVPHVASDDIGRIARADHLRPPQQVIERINNEIEQRRLVGIQVAAHPPEYRWLTVIVSLSSRPRFDPEEVRTDVLRALYRLYHPLMGGPDGTGWPFGRSAQSYEVYAALARIPGVDLSRNVRVELRPADAEDGRHLPAVERMDLPATGLVFSYDHQVRVTR